MRRFIDDVSVGYRLELFCTAFRLHFMGLFPPLPQKCSLSLMASHNLLLMLLDREVAFLGR